MNIPAGTRRHDEVVVDGRLRHDRIPLVGEAVPAVEVAVVPKDNVCPSGGGAGHDEGQHEGEESLSKQSHESTPLC